MCFASSFLYNIFSLFGLYRIFVREDLSAYIESITQAACNSYFMTLCLVVITFCSFLTQSGKSTGVLCHKAINYSDDVSVIAHVCNNFIEVSIDSVTLSSSLNCFLRNCVTVRQWCPVVFSPSTLHYCLP